MIVQFLRPGELLSRITFSNVVCTLWFMFIDLSSEGTVVSKQQRPLARRFAEVTTGASNRRVSLFSGSEPPGLPTFVGCATVVRYRQYCPSSESPDRCEWISEMAALAVGSIFCPVAMACNDSMNFPDVSPAFTLRDGQSGSTATKTARAQGAAVLGREPRS